MSHGAVASATLGEEITTAVYRDYLTAPIGEELRAALGFIRKMTLVPEDLAPDDARAALSAGVTEEALFDAIVVAFHFNMVDRVADSLGFDEVSREGHAAAVKGLLKHGYALPAPLRLLGRIARW
jgi:alkylhydroperoxidase family enzyme